MKIKESPTKLAFDIFNYIFLFATSIVCLLPFVNLLAVSLSDSIAVGQNRVAFWPVDFTVSSYKYILNNMNFVRAFRISVVRVIAGVAVNLLLIVLTAYPLSKSKDEFKHRNIYAWFFIITILFNGGMIPSYIVVRYTGLLDSILALILPGALPVFSMLVMMNFLRELPKELEEAAMIDGAGYVDILFRIILPVAKPALATVGLFSLVFHWNSWFDGMLYMNRQENYPLQSYLQTVIINPEVFLRNAHNLSSDAAALLQQINARTTRGAQLFVATLPVLCAYPFLQKYFTTGLVLGSVKG